jgi:monoamine oxidase
MPHLAITALLKRAFQKAARDNNENLLFTESMQQSRRKFLQDTAILGTGMLAAPSLLKAGDFSTNKKIVIIGAGIAGLNAAHQLKKIGLDATVYEANNRTGGRMYTIKNYFGENITTDIGGEFVDTNHEEIIALAKEFKLEFYDLRTEQLTSKTFYFGGRNYSEEELGEALKPFVAEIEKNIRSLPEIKNYTTAASFEKLDQLSIAGYLKTIGITGWLYDFIYVVLTREYGMEASEQSVLNFLIMFDAPETADTNYELFGAEHEVFKIKGGSQHLTDALAATLKTNIRLQHQLESITQNKNGIVLSFNNKGKKSLVQADYVIMTLPFSILRKIPFNADMPAQKRKCIDELGYGNSCKFIMGFKDKAWRTSGKQGYTFTDETFGCGWDSSQMQPEKEGSFTVFGGGKFAEDVNLQQQQKLSKDFVAGLQTIYPGAAKAYTRKNIKFCWAKSPVAKAGYSSFKMGQWSALAGWEAIPVGNIYFAGEHTSVEFQGYMNGAAETGKIAARQIAAKILPVEKSK